MLWHVYGSRLVRTHLIAVAYVERLDNAELINQQIHEADFISEAHQHGKAIWVQ